MVWCLHSTVDKLLHCYVTSWGISIQYVQRSFIQACQVLLGRCKHANSKILVHYESISHVGISLNPMSLSAEACAWQLVQHLNNCTHQTFIMFTVPSTLASCTFRFASSGDASEWGLLHVAPHLLKMRIHATCLQPQTNFKSTQPE